MHQIVRVVAALLLFSAAGVADGATELTGDEARAVAIAVTAFSRDPSSWKHFSRYHVTVRRASRLYTVTLTPAPARMRVLTGGRNDTIEIQNFGRSAEYVINPAANRIVKTTLSRH